MEKAPKVKKQQLFYKCNILPRKKSYHSTEKLEVNRSLYSLENLTKISNNEVRHNLQLI